MADEHDRFTSRELGEKALHPLDGIAVALPVRKRAVDMVYFNDLFEGAAVQIAIIAFAQSFIFDEGEMGKGDLSCPVGALQIGTVITPSPKGEGF